MRLICAFLTLALMSLNASRGQCQDPNPETEYYANAYADHYGVPRALAHAIIRQESSWNPLAWSAKGAAGLMQLMPETAKTFAVADRYSVTENLSGGMQYLAVLLTEFRGDMRLAVAAYYCGPTQINRYGLAYRNQDVVTYVEAVRRRYLRELREEATTRSSEQKGGK
jgi:soluble lytic murein transglycosylase-like protein